MSLCTYHTPDGRPVHVTPRARLPVWRNARGYYSGVRMTHGQCAHQQFGLESDRVKGPKTKLWSDLSDDARAAWERIAKAAVNAYAEPLVPETVPPQPAPTRPDVRARAANDT